MKIASVALLGALVLSAAAVAAEKPIRATEAYREAFGPPPVSEGQDCMAAVVYLPGIGASGSPTRLSPLPLFILTPEKAAEQAARVLVEGHPMTVRELAVPRLFPPNAKLRSFKASGGKARVRVATGGAAPSTALAYPALAYTLSQFGVKSVVLEVEGRRAVGPEGMAPAIVEPPPPVRLLDVVAPVHKGEKPAEIDVLFDRPVSMTNFSIRTAEGSEVPGTTYLSMFDMAVVFKPADPAVILRDAPLSLSWALQDKTGKPATGSRSMKVRIQEHTD
ncbi:MAG: GerMN domain-containing protein [Deltaproteobacteria bacterium]|nr:GerMN domain-containing protein [Deltaproteobacteria bacterium]